LSKARIAAIDSYEEGDAIRLFVRQCLESREDITNMLREGDPSRLVVVKPNWVQASHEYELDVWVPVITHPVVLVTVLEEVAEMMGGRGTIAVCDAPTTYADFPAIIARGNLSAELDRIRARWTELSLELLDLRREIWVRKEEVVVSREPNPPDPRGYTRLDLGRNSLFYGFRGEGRYYGADYDDSVVNEHHRGEVQEYLLAGTSTACDLFINVPKLKTHKKTGITCCLKNLVGINGDKNWLPHHTEGAPENGGDEYPAKNVVSSMETRLKKAGRVVALRLPRLGTWTYRKLRNTGKNVLGDSEVTIRNGNWHGNDTTWRMALDLNRALLYGNHDGTWREDGAAKKYLAFVDGIEGGQGSGPICPEPADSKLLLFGDNPATVDAVAARLIGFAPWALPIVRGAFEVNRWPIADCERDEIAVEDARVGGTIAVDEVRPALPGGFAPHFGWVDMARLPEAERTKSAAADS
jgi:uncharacterized protein (DUF362 family)